MVYVADNETKDVIVPNQLGMLTIRFLRPRRLHRDPSDRADARATLEIPRTDDLPSFLVRY